MVVEKEVDVIIEEFRKEYWGNAPRSLNDILVRSNEDRIADGRTVCETYIRRIDGLNAPDSLCVRHAMSEIHHHLGAVLQRLGDVPTAIEMLDKSVEYLTGLDDPRLYETFLLLGKCWSFCIHGPEDSNEIEQSTNNLLRSLQYVPRGDFDALADPLEWLVHIGTLPKSEVGQIIPLLDILVNLPNARLWNMKGRAKFLLKAGRREQVVRESELPEQAWPWDYALASASLIGLRRYAKGKSHMEAGLEMAQASGDKHWIHEFKFNLEGNWRELPQ